MGLLRRLKHLFLKFQPLCCRLSHSIFYQGRFQKRVVKYRNENIVALMPAKGGQKPEAEKAFAEISEISKKRPVSRYVLARSLAALGNKEKALDELEKAFQERDSLMIVMKIDQNFDEIRDELRFQEILRKMNLAN